MNYVDFFSELGFDFYTDLKSRYIFFDKNSTLTDKLSSSVFFYENPNNTNTSFYLIITTLSDDELKDIRRYIWNRNDADLIFYYPEDNEKIELAFAKYSPKINYQESILDTFSINQQDLEKIEKIKHWQFDSGAFWLNYHSFINKAKFKGIDKELVLTLKALKEQLNSSLYSLIPKEGERNEVVQALIDRTLYIKYLEDNHIISAHFYNHYFNDETLDYQKLLEGRSKTDINKLFKQIHELFNNALFDRPTIDNNYLTNEICNLIASSFKSNLQTGQLRLFDFLFDVLPVEFISYIYEVFLSEKQKENGIYYTPKKLAQLIIDEVILDDRIGSILDPSSGSGMFLIVGYQRLLEIAQKQRLEPENNIEKIRFRIKLLSDNIFGIEKELTAQRFTLFSLSLQIFIGINSNDIKEFIAKQFSENKKIDIFSDYSFFENIKHANTLNVSEKPFEGKQFSYLVGNPPFFEIPDSDEYKNEVAFLNGYKISTSDKVNVVIKSVVGRSQISQCFFIIIKEWSDNETRFGFISNSSNFYNDYSEVFQKYFYSNYEIEKIYELSRVKKILFEKAKESVVALIFTNQSTHDNPISYYPVDLGLFAEKPFELLVIQEDKSIEIKQSDLINERIRLRDFLVGNEFDRQLISNVANNSQVKDYTTTVSRGFEIWGEDARKKEFNLSNDDWQKLDNAQKDDYLQSFIKKYFKTHRSDKHNKPYIKPSNLKPFTKTASSKFINNIDNFHRPRVDRSIYLGKKLMFTRIGSKLNCVYSEVDDYFDFSVYTIKLDNGALHYLFQALFNSNLVEFYLDFYQRKRVFDSFSRIGNDDILNIPIPTDLDPDITDQICAISKDLNEGKYAYSEKKFELNELIYDLYELSYWEKQRIRDYFLPKTRIGRGSKFLSNYLLTLNDVIKFYIKSPITVEISSTEFNLLVAKISLSNSSNIPDGEKVKKFILNEIFEQNPNDSFFASQEKIYGKDCVYIIKESVNRNWSETKAFEDGQDLLKHLIPDENGERIH